MGTDEGSNIPRSPIHLVSFLSLEKGHSDSISFLQKQDRRGQGGGLERLGVSGFYDSDCLHHLLAAEVGRSFLIMYMWWAILEGWGRGVGFMVTPQADV